MIGISRNFEANCFFWRNSLLSHCKRNSFTHYYDHESYSADNYGIPYKLYQCNEGEKVVDIVG